MGTSGSGHEGRTYGSSWMYTSLIAILRRINIRVVYAFVAVFVVPVAVLLSPGAKLTYRHYRGKMGQGRAEALLSTFQNHIVFAKTVVDKFAMYAGHKFRIQYHNKDIYDKMTSQSSPLLQLSAHIGCSEILGYSYNNGKPACALVYGGENESLMSYRKTAFAQSTVKMIPVGTGESHGGEIIEAIGRGEIICAFADRYFNVRRTITVNHGGQEHRLARGPLSLAASCEMDVIMVSTMKERDNSYTAYFTPLPYDKSASKHEQIRQIACAYVAEKERLLTLYPLQWFNYTAQAD